MHWKIYNMESVAFLTMNALLRELASFKSHQTFNKKDRP